MTYVCRALLFSTFVFVFPSLSVAQSVFYKTVLSQQPVSSRAVNETYKDCSKEFKSYQCEEFETDKVSESDLLFDCKLKDGVCSPGEQIVTTKLGFKYRYIGYYKFSNAKECNDIDPFPPSRSVQDNVKLIVKSGLAKGNTPSKVFEDAKYYLSIPFTNSKMQRVDRSSCLSYSKGWIFDSYLKKTSKEEALGIEIKKEVQNNCQDEGECKKSQIDEVRMLAQTLVDRAQNEIKMERKNIGDKFQKCYGSIDLPSIKFNLKKVGKECQLDFSQDCGSEDVTYLEKVEQIANTIILSAPENSLLNQKCMKAKEDFSESCGDQGDFSEIQKMVSKYLNQDRKNYGIHLGYMMCIYARETTTFNPSAINFTVCQQNSNGLRKPGFENPNDPILAGKVSSANGLGGVVLETACYAIQNFKKKVSNEVFEKNYPNVSAVQLATADCGTPQGKKIVEKFFIEASQDKDKQVMLSIDALRFKMDLSNGGMETALKGYGDRNNLNYVPFVKACTQKCFMTNPPEGRQTCIANKLLAFPHKPAVGKEVKGVEP